MGKHDNTYDETYCRSDRILGITRRRTWRSPRMDLQRAMVSDWTSRIWIQSWFLWCLLINWQFASGRFRICSVKGGNRQCYWKQCTKNVCSHWFFTYRGSDRAIKRMGNGSKHCFVCHFFYFLCTLRRKLHPGIMMKPIFNFFIYGKAQCIVALSNAE